MKKYLNHPLISLKNETYLSFIILLAPTLYFLSGVNVDIVSPSMPAISTYFNASVVATKNTITFCALGWGCGALFFGILIDSLGRKKVLLAGMFLYLLSSLFAPLSANIEVFSFVRFLQGFSIASIMASRVFLVDLLSGKRYLMAMLYSAVGYGLGPIVGPFLGGLLQHYIGWRASFLFLAAVSGIVFIFSLLFTKESLLVPHPLKINQVAKRVFSVLSNKKFMAGVVIASVTQVQLMLYPTIGPFVVEKLLHQTAIVYGNSALIVGASYLTGTLMNRALVKYVSLRRICDIGFIVLISAVFMVLFFSFMDKLEMTTLMLPTFLTCVSVGLIFPNVLSSNLKQFSQMVGVAMAVQSSVLLTLASAGLFLINYVHIDMLRQLFYILLVLALVESIVFFGFYRRVFREMDN